MYCTYRSCFHRNRTSRSSTAINYSSSVEWYDHFHKIFVFFEYVLAFKYVWLCTQKLLSIYIQAVAGPSWNHIENFTSNHLALLSHPQKHNYSRRSNCKDLEYWNFGLEKPENQVSYAFPVPLLRSQRHLCFRALRRRIKNMFLSSGPCCTAFFCPS